MIAPHMTGHPPLHERPACVCCTGRNDEEEAEVLDGMPGFGRAEQLEEGGTAVATVECSDLPTRNTRHGHITVWQTESGMQEKVAVYLGVCINIRTPSYLTRG
jgi:hypothetical protein